MRFSNLVVAIGALALTGCASIVSKSDWPVSVTSASPGVAFTVKNENGVAVTHGTTPAVVVLSSHGGYFSGADYTIECAGGTTPLASRLNGWYVGNVVFGGLIGLLIVDPATGAMWKLPEMVQLPAQVPAAGL